jgi:hypothetical protein
MNQNSFSELISLHASNLAQYKFIKYFYAHDFYSIHFNCSIITMNMFILIFYKIILLRNIN